MSVLRAAFVLAWLACLCCVGACAPTLPTFSGGSTTPAQRADTFFGGAYRVPVGDLSRREQAESPTEQASLTLLGREGASPVAAARYGVSNDFDLGLSVSLTQAALLGRYAFSLDEIGRLRLIVGAMPTAGWLGINDVRGYSVGAQVPLTLAVQISGVYEGWIGVRGGIDYAQGRVDDVRDVGALRGMVGGVVGFAVGFRLISVLLELALDYESWSASVGNAKSRVDGLSITPAFAVRFRI